MHSKLSIGIAGGTGSGKTTLSKFLASGLSNYKVAVIHMDKYYKKYRPVAAAPFTGKLSIGNFLRGVTLMKKLLLNILI